MGSASTIADIVQDPDTSASDPLRAMAHLLDAVQQLSLARSLTDIQHIVRTAARELTGCDGATFVLRDNGMCYYADEDAIAPLWKGSRFPMEVCISGWSMLNRTAVAIPDIHLDNRIPHEAYRPTFVKSLVMVPIRTIDPVGAIGNYWADEHRPSALEVSLLQALADSTSIAMENVGLYSELEQRVSDRTSELERANAEIRRLSLTDELTGLNNRRGFFLLARTALLTARAHGHDCAVAFLDVDGLKQVNDEHGHDAGDDLLADAAGVLRGSTGPSDILGRWGGDEFCALVTDADGGAAALKARLLDGFRRFDAAAVRPYRLAASIGVVDVPHTDTGTLHTLLARADELMYVDKRARTTV